jgi:uncharacterized protein YdhG (YjbR/CyaY superfamily)
MRGAPKAATVDEYLDRLPAIQRAALQKLRQTILSAALGAEECISYQMPAIRYNGKVLVWFGAAAKHCAFYPGASPIRAFAEDLTAYSTSRGTIRFQPEKPLPAALIKKLVKARIAEQTANPAAR